MNESLRHIHSSFGWDLAAYGKKSNSALCFAIWKESHIHATILNYDRICKPKLAMVSPLQDTVKAETDFVSYCCKTASLYVDVPIDLQSLPQMVSHYECDVRPVYNWQLYRRPIDQMLTAISPLADHLGYPVARLANIIRILGKHPRKLFETYPGASLRYLEGENIAPVIDKYRWFSHIKKLSVKNWHEKLSALFYSPENITDMGLAKAEDLNRIRNYFLYGQKEKSSFSQVIDETFNVQRDSLKHKVEKPPYKGGRAKWNNDGQMWEARPTKNEAKKIRNQCLADLSNSLSLKATIAINDFTADEFDAVLCASVGCVSKDYRMSSSELAEKVRKHLSATDSLDDLQTPLLPTNYRILKNWPQKMHIYIDKSPIIHDLNQLMIFLSEQRHRAINK